jgi:hypothetical protein
VVHTVTNNADGGPGSLRYWLQNAGAGDQINFAPSLNGQTIALTSGELVIGKHLDLEGPGPSDLSISGSGSSRVFAVSAGVAATVGNLTITDGSAGRGGGIDNAGVLTISSCVLSGNQALGGPGLAALGGAIWNELGAVVAIDQNSMFAGNKAIGAKAVMQFGQEGAGGGLANEGAAIVSNSTFINNQAVGGIDNFSFNFAGSGYGGAIVNAGPGASLKVIRCSFMDNAAAGGTTGAMGVGGDALGGAIANSSNVPTVRGAFLGPGGDVTIDHSMFTDNLAIGGGAGNNGERGGSAWGGAIFNDDQCTLMVTASPVTGNKATGTEGGDGTGGGVCTAGNFSESGDSIEDNSAQGGDSALTSMFMPFAGTGHGGGLAVMDDLTRPGPAPMVLLQSVHILGNKAQGGDGTITGVGNGGDGAGGGIWNFAGGVLTVENSTIADNQAIGGPGGGLAASARGLDFGGAAAGGGIENEAGSTLNMVRCDIASNQATGGLGDVDSGGNGGLAQGGGIDNGGALNNQGSRLSMIFCNTDGNQALGGSGANGSDGIGGGICVVDGTAFVFVSTVVDNSAQGGHAGSSSGSGGNGLGGGIAVLSPALFVAVIDAVTANHALSGNGTPSGQGIGGGVYDTGIFVEFSTFVFNNVADTSNNDIYP